MVIKKMLVYNTKNITPSKSEAVIMKLRIGKRES